jgi:predicted amidophosphoribosyltransferase
MVDNMKLAIAKLTNLLFPPSCLLCNEFIDQMGGLCPQCWIKIDFTTDPACAICHYPFSYEIEKGSLCGSCLKKRPRFTQAFSVFRYNEHSKLLIHQLKYSDKTYFSTYLANWLARVIKPIITEIDYIIPVPLHKRRLLKRLYNQAAIMHPII